MHKLGVTASIFKVILIIAELLKLKKKLAEHTQYTLAGIIGLIVEIAAYEQKTSNNLLALPWICYNLYCKELLFGLK